MTQANALSILKTGVNVFLTGEPGSGKTHTVNAYVSYLRQHGIEPAITASTGIAATHIGGMTIHSWSGVGIRTRLSKYELDQIATSERVVKRLRRTSVLIIDEASMLSPETFALVEAICREAKQRPEPFGGLQVVLVGDFFQLPPVRRAEEADDAQAMLVEAPSPQFAYDSPAWTRANPITCYLTEQHRQDDSDLLSVLSAIRCNTLNERHLTVLESRQIKLSAAPARAPKLFSHNADVDRINDGLLNKLPGQPRRFPMSAQGPAPLVDALKRGCLSPETLLLKPNAAVMFTKNSLGGGFVNGTLGTVTGFEDISRYPIVKIRSGRIVVVEPMSWSVEEHGRVRATITQLPLRLAWAITVHKSQGMSLDEAVMDLSQVFEYGQGYVALSRVRRLTGLHLLGWNERAFQVHPEVCARDDSFRAASYDAEQTFAQLTTDELAKLHRDFIAACGGQQETISVHPEKREKVDTHLETLRLWNEGKTMAQIAKERGLKGSTIFSHIEKLAAQGKIPRSELSRLLNPALDRALPKILAAFQELDTRQLTPVFEKLGGRYSFDELRVARMMLRG